MTGRGIRDADAIGPSAALSCRENRACQVSIIVPTFREAENVPLLVARLSAALADAQLTGEIVIVDDNSSDGTTQICAELARVHPLRLVVRTLERGLAGAVVRGLHEARGEVLVVMDADLSHPPEVVPDLFHALQTGDADFVIGSRYVAGARTDENWGWFRRLNSKVATCLARPLTSAQDPMAGFFALRRSTYERGAQCLNPIGYKIGLELMVKCRCRKLLEVPIEFRDRQRGTSKLNLREQINFLRHLGRLYLYRLRSRF